MTKYVPTIGIECHVQLKTKTKLFAAVDNDAREAKPNEKVSTVCFGLPGVLPVLNEAAVELGIRAGHALNAQVNTRSVFDRKLYFYPDLPKGYQISQFHEPIVGKGHIDVPINGAYVKVGITRAHLEEDAGKLTHVAGTDYSLVDLNRAGTPLLEIVSEPDIHSAEVAKAYAQELYYLMKYAEVSDVDLYHGNMRFDVNVSVAEEGAELGIRTETKNLNSFKSVERAVKYEIQRQIDILESGKEVVQETRGWDDNAQKTYVQRSKEDSMDYRYFPDPDIPPVILSKEEIEAQQKLLPQLPKERREAWASLKLDGSQVETLIDRRQLGDLLMAVMSDSAKHGKRIANWLSGDVTGYLVKQEVEDVKLDAKRLVHLAELVDEGKLNSNAASAVVVEMITSTKSPEEIAEAKNLVQLSDSSELEAVVMKVLDENESAKEDILDGQAKAIGFIVGQVMKATQGKANPQMVQQIIKDKLKL